MIVALVIPWYTLFMTHVLDNLRSIHVKPYPRRTDNVHDLSPLDDLDL